MEVAVTQPHNSKEAINDPYSYRGPQVLPVFVAFKYNRVAAKC